MFSEDQVKQFFAKLSLSTEDERRKYATIPDASARSEQLFILLESNTATEEPQD